MNTGQRFLAHEFGKCAAAIAERWHSFRYHAFIALGDCVVILFRAIFLPLAILWNAAKASRTLLADTRDATEVIRRIRDDSGNTRLTCDYIDIRAERLPWSRTYRVMKRCCDNEARKRKVRILRELREVGEELNDRREEA